MILLKNQETEVKKLILFYFKIHEKRTSVNSNKESLVYLLLFSFPIRYCGNKWCITTKVCKKNHKTMIIIIVTYFQFNNKPILFRTHTHVYKYASVFKQKPSKIVVQP